MRVIFNLICQADEKYNELSRNLDKKENRIILKKIDFFKERIKQDCFFGEIIKKKHLEKNKALLNHFFQRYDRSDLFDIDTCFCCDLTRTEWRMLYTLAKREGEDKTLALCFMIVDHETYEKYFT